MDITELLKQFGFPIASAVIVGYAYWRATTDRIKKLESITARQGVTIEELQEDRLDRAEKYAAVLRDISLKLGSAIREQSQVMRDQHVVLKATIDAMNLRPQASVSESKKTPSSADLPAHDMTSSPTDLFPTDLKGSSDA